MWRRWAWLFGGLAAAFGIGYGAASWLTGDSIRETATSPGRPVPMSPPSPAPPALLPLSPPTTPAPPSGGPSPGAQPETLPPGLNPQTLLQDPARRGDVLFEAGRYREAIPFYRRALEANPRDADTWNDLGLALHYAGKGQEALEALRRGTKIDPPYQRVWLSLGFVSYRLGLRAEARSALERAVAIAPASEMADEARKFLKDLK